MMTQNIVGNALQLWGFHNNSVTDFRMQLHDFPFVIIQLAGFVEDAVINADFADIVQLGE
jgi:hypothetical protein